MRGPLDSNGRRFDELPAVEDEISTVTDLLASAPANVLVDYSKPPTSPTKNSVLEALPEHAWAHFACHALTNPARPVLSQLLLSDHQDNPFTVLDLTNITLPDPELLYLSACSTARTGPATLDDPVHFAAAAQLAGYRHVIATLWPLLDTAEPATLIYSDLTQNGQPRTWDATGAAVAVHRTTHYLRANGPTLYRETPQVPVHQWATLIHIGP